MTKHFIAFAATLIVNAFVVSFALSPRALAASSEVSKDSSVDSSVTAVVRTDVDNKSDHKSEKKTSSGATDDATKRVNEAAKTAAATMLGVPPPSPSSDKDKDNEGFNPEPDSNDPVAVAKRYCTSPRAAAEIIFGWLKDPNYTPEQTARCFFPGEGKNAKSREELRLHAIQLKTIVLEKGIKIDLMALSSDSNYVNRDGVLKAELTPDLPGVYMRKFEDMWGVTPRALQQIEVTYKNGRSFFTSERMELFPPFLQTTAFGIALWQFIAIILLLLMGMGVRKLLFIILTSRLERLAKFIGKEWLNRFINAGISPLATLLMAGLFAVVYPQLNLPTKIDAILDFAIRFLTIFSMAWFFYRLADVFCDLMATHASKTETKLDDQLVPLVRRILKVTIVIVGVLFVLQNLSVDIGSLLAGLGIGGIAIAMAAKDTISNFFGSVVIFTDKPFQIGDWVVIDGAEGVVEVVGFRSTQIRTFYDSVITVPNSKVADAKIDNYGMRNYRRCSITVGVSYTTRPDQMQAFVEGIRAIIRANAASRKDYYEVHFSGFTPYSLEVMLYFFLKCSNWTEELTEKHNIFLEVLRLADALGIEFAMPTQILLHQFVAPSGDPRPMPPNMSREELNRIVRSFGPGGKSSHPSMALVDGGWSPKMPFPPPSSPENSESAAAVQTIKS